MLNQLLGKISDFLLFLSFYSGRTANVLPAALSCCFYFRSLHLWQKYHIVISDNKAMLWRGEAVQYTEATENVFDGSLVIEAVLKMIKNKLKS